MDDYDNLRSNSSNDISKCVTRIPQRHNSAPRSGQTSSDSRGCSTHEQLVVRGRSGRLKLSNVSEQLPVESSPDQPSLWKCTGRRCSAREVCKIPKKEKQAPWRCEDYILQSFQRALMMKTHYPMYLPTQLASKDILGAGMGSNASLESSSLELKASLMKLRSLSDMERSTLHQCELFSSLQQPIYGCSNEIAIIGMSSSLQQLIYGCSDDIAIIGMSRRFTGSDDVDDEFWDVVGRGLDLFRKAQTVIPKYSPLPPVYQGWMFTRLDPETPGRKKTWFRAIISEMPVSHADLYRGTRGGAIWVSHRGCPYTGRSHADLYKAPMMG